MDKLIKDGMVAVLVSPGFGAGWSTWGNQNCFDPIIAQAILDGADRAEVEKISKERYPEEYHGGCRDLCVRWLPEGTSFYIHEYDGSESIRTSEDLYMTA